MKRAMPFLPILLLLSLSAFTNSVNRSTQPYSYANAFTSPAGSWQEQYFGTGVGIVSTGTQNSNGWNYFEAWSGTTVGYVTHFANTWSQIADFNGTFSNATFNSKTDVLTAAFSGSEFVNGSW